MFFLGAIAASQFNVVNPSSEITIHVQSSFCQPLWKDNPGTFFGDPIGNSPPIGVFDLFYDIFLSFDPFFS